MNPSPQERLLDACLEEVLGNHQPPDLTEAVLRRLREQQPASPGATIPAPPPLPAAPPVASPPLASPPVAGPPLAQRPAPSAAPAGQITPAQLVRPRVTAVRRRRSSTAWKMGVSLAAAAALAGVVWLGAGLLWRPPSTDGGGEVAREGGPIGEPDALPADVSPLDSPDTKPASDRSGNSGRQLATSGPRRPPEEMGTPFDDPPFDVESPATSERDRSAEIASSQRQLPDDVVIEGINETLVAAWDEAAVTTEPCTDEQWCRRAFLRLLGRIPTVAELRAHVEDQRGDKREQLVQQLQQSPEYREEYVAHWATFWANLLIGRRGGMDPSDAASRRGLERYLRQAIAEDRPYDQIVRELLSATGSGRPGAEDFNGAANFLLDSFEDPRGLIATSRSFRLFHGRQVSCLQCHTHPMNDTLAQEQYWQLNSFFRQTAVERGPAGPRLVNRDFRGEGRGDLDRAEVYFEMLNGLTVAALPAFPGAEPVSPSGRVEEIDRRATLARLMTADPQLAVAAVNRLWAHFHGYGFTRPVDDMGPHNPPSHPELLRHLADEFAASGYRLSRLVRWMALSDSFSRGSRVEIASSDSPEAGQRPLFSRYYTRQLQPEAVYDSLRMVADAAPAGDSLQGRVEWLGQFTQPMGTDDGAELSTFRGDIRQSLIIMNGPLMRRATDARGSGMLQRVVSSDMSLDEKVEHLFLAAVARQPTRRELQAVRQLRGNHPDEAAALESIWWALLNSNEFILDH